MSGPDSVLSRATLMRRDPHAPIIRGDTQIGFPSTTLIIVVVGVMDLSSKPDAFSSDRNWASERSWPPGEHVDVHVFGRGRCVAGGNDAVNDQ